MNKKTVICLIVCLMIFIGGIVLGWKIFTPREQKVTEQIVLQQMQSMGFFISQSYVFNDPIKIENKTGNLLSDFFWAQEVEGYGTVKVNLGVDLAKMTQNDIKITNDKITVYLPPISIYDASLVGELNVKNKQGILKKLFDNDDGYNLVLNQLFDSAKKASSTDELISSAENSAKTELANFLKLIVKDKEIEIVVSK